MYGRDIYLFMAVLGLRFCVRAFSSCGKWGPLFIVVHGAPTIAASLAAEHRLQTRRLSSCGSRAQPLRGMWDPPRPGLEPVSPALAGRLSTTAPPGKPGREIWTPMFIAALLTIAKRWKQPKCPSVDGWVNRMWYIHIHSRTFYNMDDSWRHYAKW